MHSAIARRLQSAVVASKETLSSSTLANQLFVFLAPVVKDMEGTPSEESDVKVCRGALFRVAEPTCCRLLSPHTAIVVLIPFILKGPDAAASSERDDVDVA